MSSLIGAAATIVGALIGVAGMYLFGLKRKRLTFLILHTENLTGSLHGHRKQIVVSVDGQPFLDLNRAVIVVINKGNTSVGDFKFEIRIPGQHHGYLHEIIADNAELYSAIKVTSDQPPRTLNPVLRVDVGTYLNHGESFKAVVFFDGAADTCEVTCRIENVRVKIRMVGLYTEQGEPFLVGDKTVGVLLIFAGALAVAVGVAVIGQIISVLGKLLK